MKFINNELAIAGQTTHKISIAASKAAH